MLKVGLIGCGGIGTTVHIPAYNMLDNIEVVALCDINESKFKDVLADLKNKPVCYTDYKEMIEKEQLDFIDICTPNYLHAEIAIYAMEHDVHVFSEKPDTITVEKAMMMKEAQERTGKHLMVMRNNRHRFSSKELKQKIKNGEFGDIYAGRCGWVRRRGIPGKGGWFTTKEQSGGGPLIDLGVHIIDLTMYLMGNFKPVSVSGSTFTKFANSEEADSVHSSFGDKIDGGSFDVEDLAMGFIKFENGACMQIEFSWASNIAEEKTFIELRGEKLGVEWLGDTYEIFDGTESKASAVKKEKARQIKNTKNGHLENIRHFSAVIEGKEDPDFVMDQGVNMIKILRAIYKSAETGREVLL